MSTVTFFTVEVLTSHLHALGVEKQVDADVWHDGLYHVLRDGPWVSGHHTTEADARSTIQRLQDEAHIPRRDIRLTRTEITELI